MLHNLNFSERQLAASHLLYLLTHKLTTLFCSGGNAVPIENSDRALATVSKLTAGEYKFRLTVTDEEGLQSSATLTVTVKESK